ncbi:hypothetical protein DM860_002880 [Cuscuta australis]|uniref:Pectinesterase n=1 Tax=Cuscuta australis TaxID=267555 RepID=A0A328D0T0_9ASTE|nr:hypothetical protein DM860_002880 [Cuscuta australis]
MNLTITPTNILLLDLLLLHLSCILCPNNVASDDTVPIPPNKDQVNSWFRANVLPLEARNDGLDPALARAEANATRIRVSRHGGGDFETISGAVDSIPAGNARRVIVSVSGGTYRERVKIEREKPFVTLYGDPENRPTIVFDSTAAKDGTVYSATLYVLSDYFSAVNIDIVNSAPRPDGKSQGAQAVAVTQSGDKASYYNCKMKGFQDTFCDNSGKHFFKDCYIEGTVDFIFGNGKSLYVNTELHVIEGDNMAVITAQARHTSAEDTGYSFAHCKVTGKGTGGLLGRGWMTFSRVIISYTEIGNAIKSEGWIGMKGKPEDGGTTFFGEYKNSGPGSNMNGRPKFVRRLTGPEVKPFLTLGFIEASKWLLPPTTKV